MKATDERDSCLDSPTPFSIESASPHIKQSVNAFSRRRLRQEIRARPKKELTESELLSSPRK